jgi:hypothetical protein
LGFVVGVRVAYLITFTAQLAIVAARVRAPLSDILKVIEAVEEFGEEGCGDGASEEDDGCQATWRAPQLV